MNYISTRDKSVKVTAAQAIAQGISEEGGLFVPDEFPSLTASDFIKLKDMDYKAKARYILKSFLNDFSDEEIEYCVNGAYTLAIPWVNINGVWKKTIGFVNANNVWRLGK